MNTNQKFEKLKTKLFKEGTSAIEDFIGYSIENINESKDTTDNRLNLTFEQMPNEELELFFKKYNID